MAADHIVSAEGDHHVRGSFGEPAIKPASSNTRCIPVYAGIENTKINARFLRRAADQRTLSQARRLARELGNNFPDLGVYGCVGNAPATVALGRQQELNDSCLLGLNPVTALGAKQPL